MFFLINSFILILLNRMHFHIIVLMLYILLGDIA